MTDMFNNRGFYDYLCTKMRYCKSTAPEHLVYPEKTTVSLVDKDDIIKIINALYRCDVDFFRKYYADGGKNYIGEIPDFSQNKSELSETNKTKLSKQQTLNEERYERYVNNVLLVDPRRSMNSELPYLTNFVPILSLATPSIKDDPEKEKRYIEIVELALKNGMSINACTSYGISIIENCIATAIFDPKRDITKAIRILHNYGAMFDINSDTTEWGHNELLFHAITPIIVNNQSILNERTTFDAFAELTKGEKPVIGKIKSCENDFEKTFYRIGYLPVLNWSWSPEEKQARLNVIDSFMSMIDNQGTPRFGYYGYYLYGLRDSLQSRKPSPKAKEISHIIAYAGEVIKLFEKHHLISSNDKISIEEKTELLKLYFLSEEKNPKNVIALALRELLCQPYYDGINIKGNEIMTAQFRNPEAAERAQDYIDKVRAERLAAEKEQEQPACCEGEDDISIDR